MRSHSLLLLYTAKEREQILNKELSWQTGRKQVSEVLVRENIRLFYRSGLAFLPRASRLECEKVAISVSVTTTSS